jgi:hypothetical protein
MAGESIQAGAFQRPGGKPFGLERVERTKGRGDFMTWCMRLVIAALPLGIGAQAQAVPLSVNLAVTADDSNGRGIDADAALSPNEHFTLNASAGYSEGSKDTGDLRGTLIGAGASFHGDRGGISLNYDRFDDSSNYTAATIGARAWIDAGDFEIALLGRQRDMSVNLTLQLPLRLVTREVDFSAVGAGLQVTYAGDNFSAYAMALKYDYDDDFNNFLDLADSPLLDRRPRIEALLGSFLTQAQGAIDRQAGAGVERSFGRNSLALDFSTVHDAVLDGSSSSIALSFRRAQTAHLDWSVSAGMVDSEAYGDIAFAGFSVGLAN